MKRNIALVPAAGVGARFGAALPKQYVEIEGKTVLQHTVECLLDCADLDYVAVVLMPQDCWCTLPENERLGLLYVGGDTRAQSVANGLAALLDKGIARRHDNVLVHDAARCCLPLSALQRLLAEAGNHDAGGILALPATDTVKRVNAQGEIVDTVPRNEVWLAQTPQLFQAALLEKALSAADLNVVTDEASAVERLGVRPLVVQGDVRNIKLTQPQDEYRVRHYLREKQENCS